jgi:bacterial/archaeal transporter family-2 protein
MQTAIFVGLAFLMGNILSIYMPMNSSVAKYLGSPLTANVTFFFVALITSIILFFIFGKFDTLYKVKDVPIYLYLTGFVSAFFVLGTTFLVPNLGARKFFILLIAGQIVMAVAVSHFGVLESPKDPVTIKKAIGAALVVLGAMISTT